MTSRNSEKMVFRRKSNRLTVTEGRAVAKGHVNHKSPVYSRSHFGFIGIFSFFIAFPYLAYVFVPLGFIPQEQQIVTIVVDIATGNNIFRTLVRINLNYGYKKK